MAASINFRHLRELVTPYQVLRHFGFSTQGSFAGESSTACVDPSCRTRRGREATFNNQVLHCHRCGKTWDALAMWSHLRGVSTYTAAIELCATFGIAVPYNIQRQPE